jgi:hypothetical protein
VGSCVVAGVDAPQLATTIPPPVFSAHFIDLKFYLDETPDLVHRRYAETSHTAEPAGDE